MRCNEEDLSERVSKFFAVILACSCSAETAKPPATPSPGSHAPADQTAVAEPAFGTREPVAPLDSS
jgi:hypothetical protein